MAARARAGNPVPRTVLVFGIGGKLPVRLDHATRHLHRDAEGKDDLVANGSFELVFHGSPDGDFTAWEAERGVPER